MTRGVWLSGGLHSSKHLRLGGCELRAVLGVLDGSLGSELRGAPRAGVARVPRLFEGVLSCAGDYGRVMPVGGGPTHALHPV